MALWGFGILFEGKKSPALLAPAWVDDHGVRLAWRRADANPGFHKMTARWRRMTRVVSGSVRGLMRAWRPSTVAKDELRSAVLGSVSQSGVGFAFGRSAFVAVAGRPLADEGFGDGISVAAFGDQGSQVFL